MNLPAANHDYYGNYFKTRFKKSLLGRPKLFSLINVRGT